MGEHHVPLTIDENNNVTSVGDTNLYEDCILCGTKTTTLKTTHIDYRTGYIEGAGQLCIQCYTKGSSEGNQHITIPKYFINEYSSDSQLGEKVRKYYFENYL